jgi:hypothetical protein
VTTRILVGLPPQWGLGGQISGVWRTFGTVRLRVKSGELVGIQERGLLAVNIGESEGGRWRDLGVGIVGVGNDCRILRVIGLVRLECQKEGMEVGHVRLPKGRTVEDSSRRTR